MIDEGYELQKAYEDGFEAGRKPNWISVEEALPKPYNYVLVRFPNDDMAVACVFDQDEDFVFWQAQTDMGWESEMDFSPTHWMKLPEPPKMPEGGLV